MFRVYATIGERVPLSRVAALAQRAERVGFDGLCVPEATHDGLLAAASALAATTRLRVATSVLVAFPRSPMVVAIAAWDLREAFGDRFELGLGTQVRGNIVGRYGTAWTAPVPRMREYVAALRAIFACFRDGTPLDFRGEHYRFTRLQPFFRPPSLEGPAIPIALGAVGPGMLRLAGEVADVLPTHPTNSAPRVLRELTRPRLAEGARRSGRDADDVALRVGPLCATGIDAAGVARAREAQRRLLGFLFSTPAYWPSLAVLGWEERGRALHALSREKRWQEMADRVDDEMLDALVPSATWDEIAPLLRSWYGGLAAAIALPLPDDPAHDGAAARAVAALQS